VLQIKKEGDQGKKKENITSWIQPGVRSKVIEEKGVEKGVNS